MSGDGRSVESLGTETYTGPGTSCDAGAGGHVGAPSRLKIVIDGPRYYTRGRGSKKVVKRGWWIHPSLNEWAWASRPAARHRIKGEWAEKIAEVCAGKRGIRGQVIVVVWSFIPTDRDRDVDNLAPKFILDGLVEAGMIDGDGRRVIADLRCRIRLDRKNPRTEIEAWTPTPDELLELGLARDPGQWIALRNAARQLGLEV